MKADTKFEPAEPRVTVEDSATAGTCNVYGCGPLSTPAKVWNIDLGGVRVRLCRRHARALRAKLPRQ